MAASLAVVCGDLDVFLTLTKAEHFLLYLPYDGHSMLEFLDSCFHREFMRHAAARGFREVAVFAERAWLGRLFVLLSRRPQGRPFDLENSRALQTGGVFTRAFSVQRSGLLPAYAVESNTLLVQHDGFYEPQKLGGSHGAGIDMTGAQTLLIYAGLRDGLYGASRMGFSCSSRLTRTADIGKRLFLDQQAPRKCGSMRWSCSGDAGLNTTPNWLDLFPPPWDKPYRGIYKMPPYMTLNVLTSELEALADKPFSYGHDDMPSSDSQRPTSQTKGCADKMMRRAKQAVHECRPHNGSLSSKMRPGPSGQYASSSNFLNKLNPRQPPTLGASPEAEPARVIQAESRWPSTDPHRSNGTTRRGSPAPSFQSSFSSPSSTEPDQSTSAASHTQHLPPPNHKSTAEVDTFKLNIGKGTQEATTKGGGGHPSRQTIHPPRPSNHPSARVSSAD